MKAIPYQVLAVICGALLAAIVLSPLLTPIWIGLAGASLITAFVAARPEQEKDAA